ncbi:hypothetical protein TRV_04380 [Trichophyton verrucosum HKI 0517]|uniref:F-box domain-containing protein n=1 Tax=Trichophyton verrucosum (strain HKI 0517) TaxID=663202 RepID=D4DB81_TRIVH|nr:uncharacterized protein TRV_04380 [Trichophyton verrucosum HKI 0517]EFE40915.1 hypothetical protein TRV_04380 [Trichophyton verrucosum HKI 0517]
MAALETIPEEIFLAIFDHLGCHRYNEKAFLPFAAISKRWQRAIERFPFKSFKLNNTQLSTFASLFQGAARAHRKALVRKIDLTIELPPYDGDDCHQHEELNNQIFSTAIHDLFQVLETFNEDEAVKANFTRGVGIEIRLSSIESPKDEDIPYADKEYKFQGTFIKLLNPERLPTLECVTSFYPIAWMWSRRIDPVAGIQMASKLKNLNRCITYYRDSWECTEGGTKGVKEKTLIDNRHDFSLALSNYTQSVKDLSLRSDSWSGCMPDEAMPPPKFISFTSSTDTFSLAIHEFIQRANVSDISICGLLPYSSDILWPYKDVKDAPKPLWPNLTSLCISVSAHTPDGDWYFKGDPALASDSEFMGPNDRKYINDYFRVSDQPVNMFRSIPVPERIDPFLKAMALVIRHAPSLESLHLCFGEVKLRPGYVKAEGLTRRFSIYYKTPGDQFWFDKRGHRRRPRIICDVGNNWRASKEIEQMWMEALGPNGLINYHH